MAFLLLFFYIYILILNVLPCFGYLLNVLSYFLCSVLMNDQENIHVTYIFI